MKKTINALGFAMQGLKHAFVNERNFKIEIFMACAAIIAGYAFHISVLEWLIIVINIGFVLATELINTAIEKLCDMITNEIRPAIKIIKDVAAAAVLLAACTSFVCALVIFIPPICKLFHT